MKGPPPIALEALRHHLQPRPFMLLQASDDSDPIRRRRIPLGPEHLVQRLYMNPGLLCQRRSRLLLIDLPGKPLQEISPLAAQCF